MGIDGLTHAADRYVAVQWSWVAKRTLDMIGAICGLVLFSPLFLLIAILVKLDSPGPAFYRQARVGRGGNLFTLLKFRTMHQDSDELLSDYLQLEPNRRNAFEQFQKVWRDPRLTRSGWILRRTSLDELPQLWNVLRGEMSLVGPRPFLPEQRPAYGQGYELYLRSLPGMTGLWQISGRNQLSFTERGRLDQEYLSDWSLWGDLQILLITVIVVVRGRGAC